MNQWFERQKTRACVPYTPYTSDLKFVPSAGKVCGAATHAVGGDADYGLLRLLKNLILIEKPFLNKPEAT